MPQPRLLATITAPHELANLELPDAWALKPVGAAYSQGLVLVDGGKVLNNQGLPYNLWEVVPKLFGKLFGSKGKPDKRLCVKYGVPCAGGK